ncbi:MAG: hypothetical protein QM796_16090 [Chthoniobacteraceae bacterium]
MKTAAAILVFTAVATCTGIVSGWAGHGLTPAGAWGSLFIGLLAAIAAWRSCPRVEKTPCTRWEIALLVVFGLFALRAFCWVVFASDNSIKVLSPNNLGDMSLHLTYIHYFANGAPIWPANPIYAQGTLQYPVGVDYLNAMLEVVGVPTLRGIVWVGLIGSAVTGYALLRWGRAFGLAGFLANGGVAGFVIVAEFIHHLPVKLEDFQAELAWKSLPLAIFVTQRCMLYAIPAGLLLLTSWRARYFGREGEPPKWVLPLWIEWLLYSAMPLFHVHTFLALSFMLGVWVLIGPNPQRWKLLRFIAASFLPATVLVVLVTAGFQSHSMIHLKIGWMQDQDNFFHFWIRNFGVLPLFVFLLVGLAIYKRDRAALAFVVPAVTLFLICCFVAFAQWEWDNTKLMIWSYLIVLPFLWEKVVAEQPFWMRMPICVVLFFSGFVSLLGGIDATHQGYDIAQRSELDSLVVPLEGIPVQATFAAISTYNHPLELLGRKVVEGYQGHLMSYGVDYTDTDHKLQALMNGSADWRDLAKDLGVEYIFWGHRESEAFPNSAQPWVNSAELVAADRDWRIFRITAAK